MNKFLCVLAVLGFAGAASAQVTNGGFETGDFTGWNAVAAGSGSLFGVDPSIPHTGQFGAYFGATSGAPDTISQDVATIAGQEYTLSFWLANGSEGGDSFRALWNGVEVYNNNINATFDYTEFTFSVFGGAGATSSIQFESFDGPSFYFLDDVSGTAGPAPGAAALLGLGGLAAVRRRRAV